MRSAVRVLFLSKPPERENNELNPDSGRMRDGKSNLIPLNLRNLRSSRDVNYIVVNTNLELRKNVVA